jgi:hypothetical protein
MRPWLRALPKPALAIAIAFLAVGSVVQASIRRHHRRHDPPHARFDIAGRLAAPLQPGVAQKIDIALSNRIRHELWISNLRVTLSIDPAHAAAGCSATRDFVVTQLPRAVYPIRLPPRSTYTRGWRARLRVPTTRRWLLAELGEPVLPSITMVNLATIDQDGCKGATLRLAFDATSRMYPPHVWVRTP